MKRTVPSSPEVSFYRRAIEPLVVTVNSQIDPHDFTVGPDGVPWTTEDGETHAICEMVEGLPRILVPRIGMIRVLDEQGHVQGIIADSQRKEALEEVYHRFALPMILQAAGAEMLHASGVVGAAGVVVFCGTSGTGKSTLSYALAGRNHPHWADDSVVFWTQEHAFETVRLPFRPRVELAPPGALEFVPGGALAKLAAIVVLRRHEGGMVAPDAFHAEVRRLSPAEAFRAVLPHMYSFLLSNPERNARMMSHYFDVAARLPMFDVRFTPCIEALPRLCAIIERSCLAGA